MLCNRVETQITQLSAHIHAATFRLLELDNDRHAIRELDWYFDDDDCLVLKGRFTPDQGAVIKKVLDLIMDEDFEEQQNVSAETFSSCTRKMADVVFKSHHKPANAAGVVRRWTIMMRFCVCCSWNDRWGIHHYRIT